MQAETLNCPTCGAAVLSDATHCAFCDARLATVACPRCFSMMFVGSKHCPSCGAKATQAEAADAPARKCPRCRVGLEAIAVGGATLRECPRCDGIWVDVESFQRICEEREEQSALLGAAALVPKHQLTGAPDKIRYVPCPECAQLMNRVNFARSSGVIVDICKGHGTWFDRDELREIVEFIRGGGMEAARSREKRELEEERERLRQEQLAASLKGQGRLDIDDIGGGRPGAVSAASELLKLLID